MPAPNATLPARSEEVDRTRRRFLRRRRLHRWRVLRWLALTAVVTALVGGSLWLVYGSHYLAAAHVRVSGVGQLTPDEIEAAAQVPLGQPLARVDLTAIEARVAALAPVDSVSVTRDWPDTIDISVAERVPIAVVDVGGELRGMDHEGVLFRRYRTRPTELPLVVTRSGASAGAIKEAAKVVAAMPAELATRVDHVEVATVDSVTLLLRDGRQVIWGSADQSAEKATVLLPLLDYDAHVYDVTVPGQPTTHD